MSATLALAGCGSATTSTETTSLSSAIPKAHPQAIDPTAGAQAQAVTPEDPIGDPNAHATPLSVVKNELRQEHVAVSVNNASYIDPLQYVNRWERTDQGVDATVPVGSPILAAVA